MPDLFDEISGPAKMGDIFDHITSTKDVFDEVAPPESGFFRSLQATLSAGLARGVAGVQTAFASIPPIGNSPWEFNPPTTEEQKTSSLVQQQRQEQAAVTRGAAGLTFEEGVSPESKNLAAQAGRGAGNVLSMVPAMLTGEASLPLMALQGANDSYQSTLASGGSEEQAQAAALKTAPSLLLYMLGGKAASGLAGKILGNEAPALARGAVGAGTATVANIATGSVLRAMEAKPGERLQASIPTVESLTADTLFGVYHGIGEYRNASLEVKRKAYEELQKRGFNKEDISSASAPTEVKAEAVQEKTPEQIVSETVQPAQTEITTGGEQTYATQEGQIKQGGSLEHPQNDEGGPTNEPIDSNRNAPSGTEPTPEVTGKPTVLSTAIKNPDGTVVTGPNRDTPHKDLIRSHLEAGGDPTTDVLLDNMGFLIRDSNGQERFSSREEAYQIAEQTGQLKETAKNKRLASEIFNPEGTKTYTADEAANAFKPFREQAIAAAKAAGATDPELAADTAWSVLSSNVAEGKSTLDNPKGLFLDAARKEGLKQLEAQGRQKRGGGAVVSGDIEGPTGKTAIEEAPASTRNPRSQTITEENLQLIDDAINALPKREGDVMRLTADGMSDSEIASELGISETNVTSTRARARAKLLKRLEGLGPGAASAAETLTQYELRRFGFRLNEDGTIAPELREQTGNRYYEPLPNKVTSQEASDFIDRNGIDSALDQIREPSSEVPFPVRVTVSEIALKKFNEQYKALKESNPEEASRILDRFVETAEWLSEYGTQLGQGVQAFAMWERLTPEGKLRSYIKSAKKARQKFTDKFKGAIESITGGLNKINQEISSSVSSSKKVRHATQRAAEEGAIWDRYVKDVQNRMEGLADKTSPQERPLLEKFTEQVISLFKEKVSEPKEAGSRPPSIVRLRQMITEWPRLKDAWNTIFSRMEESDKAKVRLFAQKYGSYLDAPFTEKDIRSVMREMPMFSPRRIGKLNEQESSKAIDDLVSVVMDEVNIPNSKEVEGKIRAYASKIVEEERSERAKVEAKAKAIREAQKKEPSRPSSLSKNLWGQYEVSAIKNLERALFSKEGEASPPIQEFTKRLTSQLRERFPKKEQEPKTAQQKAEESKALIREAINNFDKYKQVWTDTANWLKLKYGDKPEVLQKLDEIFGPAFDKPFSEKTVQNLIRAKLEESNIKLSELIGRHYNESNKTGKELAQRIADELGVSKEQADLVAKSVEEEFAKMTQGAKDRYLKSLLKEKNPVLKQAKSQIQKLIEASNKGALSEQKFYDAVAEQLGLPSYSKEVSDKILSLAQKVQDSPEGMPKWNAANELANYVTAQKGLQFKDLALGYYYSNMLSGVGTQMINLVDTAANVGSELISQALANPKNASVLAKGIARGAKLAPSEASVSLKTGKKVGSALPESQSALEASRFGEKGGVPIKTGMVKSILESPLLKIANAWKYVGRAMSAADALNYRTAAEARSHLLAARLVEAEPIQGMTKAEAIDKVLGYDKWNDYLKQAETEGFSGQDKTARAVELMIQHRPEGLNKDAMEFALDATYNIKPKGLAGKVSNGIENMLRDHKVIRAIVVPFTRIVANVWNKKLDWGPWGYWRAIHGYERGEGPMTGEARTQAEFRAAIGTGVLAGIATLAATGVIELNGNGPKDPDKRKQLFEKGWKPYTIKIGDRYWSYQYTPFGLYLSSIGNYLDALKYESLSKKDALTGATYAISRIPSTLFSQSFLSGLSGVFNVLSGGDSPQAQINSLERLVAGTTSNLVPMAGLMKDIENFFDPKLYKGTGMMSNLISQIPFVKMANRPALNALGEEVEVTRNRFTSASREDPVWKAVFDHDLKVPVPSPMFTEPKWEYEYQKRSGQKLKSWIIATHNFKGMDNEVAQDAMNSVASRIREGVRGQLMREGAKLKNPPGQRKTKLFSD